MADSEGKTAAQQEMLKEPQKVVGTFLPFFAVLSRKLNFMW